MRGHVQARSGGQPGRVGAGLFRGNREARHVVLGLAFARVKAEYLLRLLGLWQWLCLWLGLKLLVVYSYDAWSPHRLGEGGKRHFAGGGGVLVRDMVIERPLSLKSVAADVTLEILGNFVAFLVVREVTLLHKCLLADFAFERPFARVDA